MVPLTPRHKSGLLPPGPHLEGRRGRGRAPRIIPSRLRLYNGEPISRGTWTLPALPPPRHPADFHNTVLYRATRPACLNAPALRVDDRATMLRAALRRLPSSPLLLPLPTTCLPASPTSCLSFLPMPLVHGREEDAICGTDRFMDGTWNRWAGSLSDRCPRAYNHACLSHSGARQRYLYLSEPPARACLSGRFHLLSSRRTPACSIYACLAHRHTAWDGLFMLPSPLSLAPQHGARASFWRCAAHAAARAHAHSFVTTGGTRWPAARLRAPYRQSGAARRVERGLDGVVRVERIGYFSMYRERHALLPPAPRSAQEHLLALARLNVACEDMAADMLTMRAQRMRRNAAPRDLRRGASNKVPLAGNIR